MAFSAVLFVLQEQVLADSNREAQRLNAHHARLPEQTFGVLNRRWIIGNSGDIYHYDLFDPAPQPVRAVDDVSTLDEGAWRLNRLVFAGDVALVDARSGEDSFTWEAHQRLDARVRAATRGARRAQPAVKYTPFAEAPISLEPPTLFQDRRAGRRDR